jgi:hypothetical protein
MKTESVRIMLVMSAVLGIAACDRQPTAPDPTPPALSLAISGNTSISGPGGTTRMTAIATYADGTTRNVTEEAQWTSGGAVSVSGHGLVLAQAYGRGTVRATYRTSTSADIQVRVAPDGAFLVTVGVIEQGYEAHGAHVQVTSPAGAYSATTTIWAPVCLPAAGDARVLVEKGGFLTITRSITVTADQDIEFVLQPSGTEGE